MKSKKLATLLINRIKTIVKYNKYFKSIYISTNFVLSEFTNEPVYYGSNGKTGKTVLYLFLNCGFKNGNIYTNDSKYKPTTDYK